MQVELLHTSTVRAFRHSKLHIISNCGAELIRGFAAKASAKALEVVTSLEQKYTPYIEEDSIVSIDGDIIQNGHVD